MNNCRNVINDESGCTVLVKRLFDAVSIPLNGAICTVTPCDPTLPASAARGSTSRQLATVLDLVQEEQCRYRKTTGKLLASGTVRFFTDDGEREALCSITLPFSSLLKYPEPSVIKPELSALVSFHFTATEASSATSFSALASGTAILILCSYTPMVIPGAFTVCPDSAPRELAPKKELPLFPRCELP